MLTSRPVSRNAEGRHAMKTPARALYGGGENTNRHAPGTGKGKGKANALQTPFPSKKLFNESDTQLKGGVRAPPRPFLDKTPFPNRIITTNQHQTPFLHVETPDSALRPSSTRRHIRVPRSSQKFETPVNTKNHWDVSDDSIQMTLPEPPKMVAEPQEDYDDVEYMPPNTLDLPYQPPIDFEMPDYKVLGKALMEASRKGLFCDRYTPPEVEIKPEDIQMASTSLELPVFEDDDPFIQARRTKPAPAMNTKSRPVPVPVATREFAAVTAGSRTAVAAKPSTSRSGTVHAPSRATAAVTSRPPSTTTSIASRGPVSLRPSRSTGTSVAARSRSAAAAALTSTKTTAGTRATHPRVAPALSTGAPVRQRPATSASTYNPVTGGKTATTMKPSNSLRSNAAAAASSARSTARSRPAAVEDEVGIVALDNVQSSDLVDDFLFEV